MNTTIKPIEVEIQLNEKEFFDEKGFYNELDSSDYTLRDLKIELSYLTGYKISYKVAYIEDHNFIIDLVHDMVKNNITKNPLIILKTLKGE